MDYTGRSDEELLCLYHSGDGHAADYLLEKYRGLVRKHANALFLTGGDSDDLNQEGMIGLYRAMRDFNPDRGSRFSTFADLCIRRQMYRAIESDGRKRNAPLNDAVPIDEIEPSLSGGYDPEAGYIENEERTLFEERYAAILSPYERKVLSLYLDGYRYPQIAQILNRTPKSAENAIQRIRTKIIGTLVTSHGARPASESSTEGA